MLQPHAHHVLWFLGTFIILWAVSLIARGLTHRPRVAGRPGPRKVKMPAVWTGLVLLPVGAATCFVADRLRAWIFDGKGPEETFTAFHAMALAVAAFALCLAAWGLWGDRARGRRRCPRCWYEMDALAAAGRLTCPECGHDAKTPARLLRTRRRWGLVALAALLAGTATLVPRGAQVQTSGVKALVPTTVMIAAFWWLPDSWINSHNLDDEAALYERMRKPDTWKWQWEWLVSRVQNELERPTSPDNLARAYEMAAPEKATTEMLVMAARGLGARNHEARLRAAKLLANLRGLDYYLSPRSNQERALLAEYADVIVQGLDDPDEVVLYETLVVLGDTDRHAERIQAVVQRDPARFRSQNLVWVTANALLHRRDDPVATKLLLSIMPSSEIARATYWRCVRSASERGPIPEPLLILADQAIKEEIPGSAVLDPLLRLRVTGRHANPALIAELAELARAPGPRRRVAILGLRLMKPDDGRDTRLALLQDALHDPDPLVVNEALAWISSRLQEGAAGLEHHLADLEPLGGHADSSVRDWAESLTTEIRKKLEADAAAAARPPTESQLDRPPDPTR